MKTAGGVRPVSPPACRGFTGGSTVPDMNSHQPSRFADSWLDLLREAATEETCAPCTDDDLIAARDYAMAHQFPGCFSRRERDTVDQMVAVDKVVAQVTGGDPDKVQDMLRDLLKSALERLRDKAKQDERRRRRMGAKEAAGLEWDPDEDEYDEWIERIVQNRARINKLIADLRKSGRAVVPTRDGMFGATFRKSFRVVEQPEVRPKPDHDDPVG